MTKTDYKRSQSANIIALYALVGAIIISIPFIGIHSLGFADHSGHLARFHILQNLRYSDALQNLYIENHNFTPYLGIGGFMGVLGPIFGVERAGQLFAFTSLFVPMLGIISLNWVVHKRISVLTLGAPIFIFSVIAGLGFFNFLLTSGTSLLVFSAWISMKNRQAKLRIFIFSIAVALVFIMHMLSVAILGIIIGIYTLVTIFRTKDFSTAQLKESAIIAAVFLPTACLMILLISGAHSDGTFFYGGLSYRTYILASPFSAFFSIYEFMVSIAFLTLVSVLRLNGLISFNLDILAIGLALYIFGLLLPFRILGVAFVSPRLPIIGMLLIIASIKDGRNMKPIWIIAIITFILIIKLSVIRSTLKSVDSQIFELRTASTTIEQGSTVLVIMNKNTRSNLAQLNWQYYAHQVGYIVIDRNILYPYMFSMYEIGINDNFAKQSTPVGNPVFLSDLDTPSQPLYARQWRNNFDYAIVMHFGDPFKPIEGTTLATRGSWFSILDVDNK